MVERDESVAETLAQSDVHDDWTKIYRSGDAHAFGALQTATAIEEAGLPPGTQVLDAGCGSGTHSIHLAKAGLLVTGIDFSGHVVDQARIAASTEGVRADFHEADITAIPFGDETFEAVFCIGVLMHVPDIEKALAELARVLKPGGKLILSEANDGALEVHAFRAYWRLRPRSDKWLKRTKHGTEFWMRTSAGPLLSRHSNIRWLKRHLEKRGLVLVRRRAGEMTELYKYFHGGAAARWLHRLNSAWFRMRGPAALAYGNLLIFQKKP